MTAVELAPELSLTEAQRQVEYYLRHNHASATMRSYRHSCLVFALWCQRHGLDFLPAEPETVALFLGAMADRYATATIKLMISGISYMHTTAGHPRLLDHDRVRAVWSGIRRVKGIQGQQKAAIMAEQVKEMARAQPDTLQGKRNRALLLIGFAGAFRRGELAGIRVEDIRETREGLTITIQRSKADQMGKGRVVGLPRGVTEDCPIKALRAWLKVADITTGYVFFAIDRHSNIRKRAPLTDQTIARIVKHAATAAGIEGDFSGLSLRAGFATSAVYAGESPLNIIRQTGHCDPRSLMPYIRHANAFQDNPMRNMGF